MESYLLSFLIPIIFGLAALFTALCPPQKINGVYGYRSQRSMSDDESWHFAQKRSSAHMFRASLVAAMGGFGYVILFPEPQWSVLVILTQTCLIPVYVFWRTEKELKKRG